MAERTVGGEVRLDYAPTGLTWRLTCSVADVREAREDKTRDDYGR
jgi:hypothetical protein